MTEKQNKKSARHDVEIVPFREHRRITLCCPNCDEFSLMDIYKKTRVKGKVNYYVTCPQCRHDFKQIGRLYNYWRDIKQRYRLGPLQVRSMQTEIVQKLLESGEIVAEETQDIIRTGDMVFIKPKQRNEPE